MIKPDEKTHIFIQLFLHSLRIERMKALSQVLVYVWIYHESVHIVSHVLVCIIMKKNGFSFLRVELS